MTSGGHDDGASLDRALRRLYLDALAEGDGPDGGGYGGGGYGGLLGDLTSEAGLDDRGHGGEADARGPGRAVDGRLSGAGLGVPAPGGLGEPGSGGASNGGGPRSRLLGAARARRRPAAVVSGYGAPYAARVAALDALLAGAREDDWSTVIVEGWTLHELVAHLMATDSLVAAAVGAPVAGPPLTANDTLGRTAEMQAYQREREPERTRAEWREQADAICRTIAAIEPDRAVDPGGMRLPISDHMLARTLETWIHTDDAARRIGLNLPLPVAEHINPMADLCARLVPWTMLLSGMTPPEGASVRVTMTGPGGGTWHVPLDVARPAFRDGTTPADAEITCDVVDLCFLFGGRRDPARFDAEIGGDAGLARQVITAAPALSGP
ncbi:maleylpyruvate isomerase family mycothiol-dependent enzyme [Thermopolyspora sp. NPDC052614]|uniref:maleylpyruvate isomerase family mycothiol-dependent enzyme n=1 Tax=Thermopolyspora sp. NPDC052614 TaxID=3155682 RepID=UPI003414C6D6